jgi:type II secretory pathway pseudopilin PulG
MALYAATVILSAFLLFLVQPLIAKLILPWFGGSAIVWNTAMVFFQVMLLAGYGYAHWLIEKLSPQQQFRLHAGLLGIAILLFPVAPPEMLKPSGEASPIWPILLVLGASVGLPYFLLATSSPLLQAWYTRSNGMAPPYRLFAFSNLASLAALLAYPIAIEPYLPAKLQAQIWRGVFILFAGLCLYTAQKSLQSAPPAETQGREDGAVPAPTLNDFITWIALAAVPSMLFLAATSHLVQNVASIPFLWVIPLSMYLLSFVLAFESDKIYRPWIFRISVPLVMLALLYGLLQTDTDTPLHYQLGAAAAGLLLFCTFAHGELAKRKPHPRHLTAFFLMIAVGGALGGILNSFVAPLVLPVYLELYVALAIFGFVALTALYRWHWLTDVLFTVATVSAMALCYREYQSVAANSRVMIRNYYGSLRVQDSTDGTDPSTYTRTLIHGMINHGLQFLSEDKYRLPTTYYGPNSGVGLAIANSWHMNHRVAVIGLGTGTLTSYARKGDYYRIYEINPIVVNIANNEFRYLKSCAGTCEIALGDARVSLEREKPQNFDVIAVDAFSGDSIPVHLLTREAFELYFKHLSPDGVLCVHISNKHLLLGPVVERVATSLGLETLRIDNEAIDEAQVFESDWVLVARPGNAVLHSPLVGSAGEPIPPRPELRVWTDDYSNLFQIWKRE